MTSSTRHRGPGVVPSTLFQILHLNIIEGSFYGFKLNYDRGGVVSNLMKTVPIVSSFKRELRVELFTN